MFKSFPQKQFRTLRQTADMRWTQGGRAGGRRSQEGALESSLVQLNATAAAMLLPRLLTDFMDVWSEMRLLD